MSGKFTKEIQAEMDEEIKKEKEINQEKVATNSEASETPK